MAVAFDQIVPWGRSRREYELMFSLSAEDVSRGVLDCGGGPASFIAELSASGLRGVSVDPIYAYSASEIQKRFERYFSHGQHLSMCLWHDENQKGKIAHEEQQNRKGTA